MLEIFGTIDAELISNTFVDNIFDFDNDGAVSVPWLVSYL
jgi:hypothetical protein